MLYLALSTDGCADWFGYAEQQGKLNQKGLHVPVESVAASNYMEFFSSAKEKIQKYV